MDVRERIWTKDFVIMSIINFFVTVIFFLLMVTIGQFAMVRYHVSTSMAGLVSSIFIVGSIIGRIIAGRFMHFGSKKLTQIGLVGLLVTTALYFVPMDLAFFTGNRLIQGLSCGIAGTAIGTMVAETLPVSRRGEGLGYFTLSAIIATAIGPFLGILLVQYSPTFLLTFIFNIVLAVFCIVASLFITRLPVPNVEVKKGFHLEQYYESRVIRIALLALILGFSYSGIMSFLVIYTKEINLVQAGSYYFLIYAITVLCTRPFVGRLFDRIGAAYIIYPSLVCFAIGMLLFSQANNNLMIYGAAVFIGIGFGNFNSVAQAFAIQQVPHERIGVATSTYFILYDVGLGIGPFLLGMLEPSIGYRGIFSSMVIVILSCIALYAVMFPRKTSTPVPQNET